MKKMTNQIHFSNNSVYIKSQIKFEVILIIYTTVQFQSVIK